jgi:hypothetical protein
MNTITQRTMKRFCGVLCVALLATCLQASAKRPRARVQRGTIERIDQDARVLRLRRHGEAVPLTPVWDNRTRLIEGPRTVTAAGLTKDTAVTVWYRSPLFGGRHPAGGSGDGEAGAELPAAKKD